MHCWTWFQYRAEGSFSVVELSSNLTDSGPSKKQTSHCYRERRPHSSRMSNHDKEDGYRTKSDTVKYLLLCLVRMKKEQFC